MKDGPLGPMSMVDPKAPQMADFQCMKIAKMGWKEEHNVILYFRGRKLLLTCLKPGGGTPIETLYGDVPPKWVGF